MSNKPTLDEILNEVFIFGGASYADDIPANEREKVHENFRLYAKNQAKQQLSTLIASIIGEDRDYKKYEPCPRCGGQYQYKCSCDDAEAVVLAEQRARAKEAGFNL